MHIAEQETIRFLRLDRTFAAHRDEFMAVTETILGSGQVVGGEAVSELESQLASRTNRRFAAAVPSGTDALRVAASAIGVDRHWEVLVPAYTFLATASALRLHTDNIRALDVDDHYQMTRETVENEIDGDRPTLVVPVGIFGNGLDNRDLNSIQSDSVVILEDAAQSFGSNHVEGPGGGFGIASTLSFAPTKVIPCFGNMGMIVTDDPEIDDRMRRLRRHGKKSPGEAAFSAGFNAMPNAVQAAQLLVLLEHHEKRARRRVEIAARYLESIKESRGFHPPPIRPETDHAWHKFVIRHQNRDELQAWMMQQGIQCQIHYPLTIDLENNIVSSRQKATMNARRLARESLSLPMYPELEDREIERICDAIRSFQPVIAR